MEDACLKTGGSKGALHDAMVPTGTFDGDEPVSYLVSGEGCADLCDGRGEVGPSMSHGGGRDEDAAIEISDEKFGTSLGAVKADDAEVLGPDLLDARMKNAARLTQGGRRTSRRGAFAGASSGHETCLR